jgi:amidohydrolase
MYLTVTLQIKKGVCVYDKAIAIHDEIRNWRQTIHKNPELSFQEHQTSALVAELLNSWGYRVQTGVGRTGVVAEKGSGVPVIGLRADMDALPIQEENDQPYASRNPGVMHACGHDSHTAMLLGVARLLADEDFPGTVRFLFQPAEEDDDDEGVSGAPRMIEDGAMEGVDHVIALHVDSSEPVGVIEIDDGPISAGVDTFYAAVVGRGGHGAAPHRALDPIHITGHVILALHGIISRRMNPHHPAVVTVGSIHAGEASNVIPERVELSGTIRYMDPADQQTIHKEVGRALQIAEAMGAEYELKIVKGYPPAFNDPEVADLLATTAIELFGKQQVKPPKASMGAEDFGFMTNLSPGAMFMLGCRIEGDERKHHSPRFDIDEDCLPYGTALLAEGALRLLKQN